MSFAAGVVGTAYCHRNKNGLNCWGLVAKYYQSIGLLIPDYLIASADNAEITRAFSEAFAKGEHGFKLTEKPKNGDVVIFSAPNRFHCGLFFDRKVLHSSVGLGVIIQPLHDIKGFKKIEYWTHGNYKADQAG